MTIIEVALGFMAAGTGMFFLYKIMSLLHMAATIIPYVFMLGYAVKHRESCKTYFLSLVDYYKKATISIAAIVTPKNNDKEIADLKSKIAHLESVVEIQRKKTAESFSSHINDHIQAQFISKVHPRIDHMENAMSQSFKVYIQYIDTKIKYLEELTEKLHGQ